MEFEHISKTEKLLPLVLNIIRTGIRNKKMSLDKKQKEGIKTQNLVQEFNYLGTTSDICWIGADKEFEKETNSKREDIYFYLGDENHTPIFFVEAKRLPKNKSKNEHEYVTAISTTQQPCGGIERYKLELHGNISQKTNAMIAYIENSTIENWYTVVNQDIENIYSMEEQLVPTEHNSEFYSVHQYINHPKEKFLMYHFWIDLTL